MCKGFITAALLLCVCHVAGAEEDLVPTIHVIEGLNNPIGVKDIISTTEATGFGQRHFEIPFDATGKRWVRFAAWDIAGNGALVQPIKLNTPPTSTR